MADHAFSWLDGRGTGSVVFVDEAPAQSAHSCSYGANGSFVELAFLPFDLPIPMFARPGPNKEKGGKRGIP